MNSNPFEKKINSLFVASSPLQILSVAEAIKTFEINDYEIIVPTVPNEPRVQQTYHMLDDYNLRYTQVNIRELGNIKIFLNLYRKKYEKYNRAFIGNYLDYKFKMIAFPYIKRNGCYVYLDDGNNSLSILKGKMSLNLINRLCHLLFDIIAKTKKCNVKDYFFTTYYDVKTNKIIYPNKFNLIKQKMGQNMQKERDVYFVGTNTNVFCQYLDIPIEKFYNIINKVFEEICTNNINKTVYYIPHGRDNNKIIEDYCEKYGIIYMKLDEAIESYLINKSIYPAEFAGFTSSALYNIKKIMPKTKVTNYLISGLSNNGSQEYKDISSYYENNGIILRLVD